jgi:hypothetical protein
MVLFNDFNKKQSDTVEVGSSNLPVPTREIKGLQAIEFVSPFILVAYKE